LEILRTVSIEEFPKDATISQESIDGEAVSIGLVHA
jgi:hypothetical protein